MCLVWPDDKPDEHIVPVRIDDDDTVADLKKLIKDEHARMIKSMPAIWYSGSVPVSLMMTT
jgi:hypothetical protein